MTRYVFVGAQISVPIGVYGLQHYISMLGSLVLIPLVIVPAMGGTHVSSFMLLVCNFFTIFSLEFAKFLN